MAIRKRASEVGARYGSSKDGTPRPESIFLHSGSADGLQ